MIRSKHLPICLLFFLYLLMFWQGTDTFRPGMDMMTFGTLSKHILETGDWTTLHYSSQAYPTFFQHPPLPMWMMAFTMKFLGTSDWVLRFLPALLSGLSVMGIYHWAKKARGEWAGFIAAFVLLTSTRFAKYSNGFMLDPFLAAFSIFAMLSLLSGLAHSKKNPSSLLIPLTTSLLGGLFIGAAFLSKGVFAFAPLIAGVLIIIANAFYREIKAPVAVATYATWVLGATTPLLLWVALGKGDHYIERYFYEHVFGRVGVHYSFHEHLEPLRNLLKVYWPWIPFLFVAGYRQLRFLGLKLLLTWEGAALITGFGFLFGFCLVASFLEQYNTSIYPFAAVVIAVFLASELEKYREKILLGVTALLSVAAAAVLIYPPWFMGTESFNPFRIVLKRAARECVASDHKRILISNGVAEIWYATAMGTWNTNWDVRSAPASLSPSEAQSDLLLAGVGEIIHKEWTPSGITDTGLRIFYNKKNCEN